MRGNIVWIKGDAGSGKTTLLRKLAGIQPIVTSTSDKQMLEYLLSGAEQKEVYFDEVNKKDVKALAALFPDTRFIATTI